MVFWDYVQTQYYPLPEKGNLMHQYFDLFSLQWVGTTSCVQHSMERMVGTGTNMVLF